MSEKNLITPELVKKKAIEFALRQNVWKEHPDIFAREVLGDTDVPQHQVDICLAVRDYKRVAIASSHSIGKSRNSAVIALWWLISNYDPNPVNDTLVLITAPTFRQVKEAVFKEVSSLYKKANAFIQKTYLINGGLGGTILEGQNTARLTIDTKNYIQGISSDSPDNIVGYHASNLLIICDEAAGIPDNMFPAMKGILISGTSKLLMLGNPVNKTGTFFNAFQGDTEYFTRKISAFETPNFTEFGITRQDIKDGNAWKEKLSNGLGISLADIEELEVKKAKEALPEYCTYSKDVKTAIVKKAKRLAYERWCSQITKKLPCPFLVSPIAVYGILRDCGGNEDDPEYLGRVLAEFPVQTASSLIPSNWLEDSYSKWSDESLWKPAYNRDGSLKYEFGVDVAGGDAKDYSVVAIKCGNKILSWEKFRGDTVEFADFICLLHKQYSPKVIKIEKDGIGKPVFDMLKNYSLPALPIQMGNVAGDKNNKKDERRELFARKRDEIWWEFRQSLDPNNTEQLLIPRDAELDKQLRVMTYRKLPNGKIKVLGKEEIKDILGQSPDVADSCIVVNAKENGNYILNNGFWAIPISNSGFSLDS